MSSRVEEILNGTYEGKPQSRIEALLAGGAGSGGSGLSQTQVNNIVDSKISEVFSNLGETIDSKVLEAIEDLDISSGGDGGSSASKIDTLFEDTTYQGITNGTINLSESITNYDTIGFITINTVGNKEIRNSISCDVEFMIDYLITNNKLLTITGYTSEYINLQMPDTRTMNIESVDRNAIVKILGIKRTNIPVIDESTILFDTPTAISTNGMVFELNDDIRKYDQVIIYRGPYSNLSTKYSGVTIYKRDIIDSIDNGNAPIRVGSNNWFSFHTSADGRSIVINQADYSAIHEIIGVKTNVLKLNHIEADISGRILNLPQKTNLIASEISLSNGMTIQLNDSIKNYDVLLFQHKYLNGSNIGYAEHEYDVSIMNFGDSSKQILSEIENGVNVWWYPNSDGDAINVNVYGGNQHTITKIIGIKNPSFFDESLLPVQDGLIRWYDAINNTGTGAHDNAASTWKDLTGNRDATVSNNSAWGDKSIYPKYSAINDNTFIYNNPTNSISLEMYLTIHTASGWQTLFDLAQQGGIFIGIENGVLKAGIHDGSNYHRLLYTIPSFMSKIHMIFTLDINSKVEILYVNGQKIEEANLSNLRYSTNILNIGRDNGTADIMNDGFIHDVRIYDKVLTPEEVQHNYAYSSQRYSNQPKIKIVNPPVFTSAEWDSLSVSEKRSKGEVIIRDAISGYERGILVNGSDYSPNPKISIIGDIGTATGKTFKIPSYGMYMVVMTLPYEGTGSISMPQDATIISSIDRDDIANGRRLCVYIATLQRNSEVAINVSVSQWPGRAGFIAKIDNVQSIINTDVNVVAQADNTTTIDDSIKEYDNYYLIYGVGIGKQPGNARDSTPVNSDEIAVTTGDWGVNSANRIAICKGSKVPNYQFYGYDGGFSAIATWRIVTWLSDDPGESLTYKPSQVIEEEDHENEEPAY